MISYSGLELAAIHRGDDWRYAVAGADGYTRLEKFWGWSWRLYIGMTSGGLLGLISFWKVPKLGNMVWEASRLEIFDFIKELN